MESSRYFDFLCSFVGRTHQYSSLLNELYGIEFYSLIPNDDNRGIDGEQLRQKFIDEAGPTGPRFLPSGPCTVLEMLIGVAYRLEFETAQTQWERTPEEWFWVLIDNLNLSFYDNKTYELNYNNCVVKVSKVINSMLAREYDNHGEGGLFPLKRAKKDQRRVEIWYQMSAYVLENYPI